MKSAKEMKQKTLQNCKIVKWIEENVPQMIEQAAENGRTYIEIVIDEAIEAPIRYQLGRSLIVDRIQEYVASFGYFVYATANNKKVTIDWNITIDK